MQAQLLVGPIPAAVDISAGFPSLSSSSIIAGISSLLSPSHAPPHYANRYTKSCRRRWDTVVVASSSSFAINGGGNAEQDLYAVLGISQSATPADVKKAYRLLSRKYHPDVSKHSHAGEQFKSIRHAYEILSNEVTRTQYDQVLRARNVTGRSYSGKQYYSPEVEDVLRIYRWSKLRQKMQSERYWEHYNVNEEDTSSYVETEEETNGGNMHKERSPFIEVLRSTFISLILLHTFGSWLSLTFISLMALFDRKLDAGYKLGFLIAWVLGGRGGILLALCLQFASWACGKTSSSVVALVVVAMWVGSNLARYAPLPQGALLTLLYMSIKLQVELN